MNAKTNATPATSSAPTTEKPFTELDAARMLLAQAECAIRDPFAPLPALAAFDAMVAKAETADAVCLAASREALALSDALTAKASALDALVEAVEHALFCARSGRGELGKAGDALTEKMRLGAALRLISAEKTMESALTAAKAAQVSK